MDFIQASPQMTLLSCTAWEVSLPPPLGGGVLSVTWKFPRAFLEMPAPVSQTSAKESRQEGRRHLLQDAHESTYHRPLPLFEKPKKEYFPYSTERPTSIWRLTPSDSALLRLSGLYVIFTRQSAAATGEPKAFSSKGDAWGTHSGPLQIRPTRNGWNKATETRRDASPSPGDSTMVRGPTPRSP